MYLYRAWHKTMQGDNLWNHIARHLVGRTAPAIRNRFLRVTQNSNDVNLDNMKRFPDKPDLPATFAFNNSHVISLTILPKSSSTIMDITTKVTVSTQIVSTIANLCLCARNIYITIFNS